MIINSVIAGKGGGDEVEAYALGDAKNAVKDDKVNLNFSANMATIEPEIQKQAVSSSSGGFIFSIQNGKYIYASQNQTSTNFTPSYKRDSSGNYVPSIGCNRSLGGSYLIGSNVYTTSAGSAYQIFGESQSIAELPDTVNSSTQVLMSDDGRVLVASNRVTSSAKLIVFIRENENAPFVELFRYTAENDRVATRFAFFPGTYDGKYRGVCMRGGPFGGEGYVSYEIDLETKSFRILNSYSGGKYKYNPICYKDFVVYLAKISGFTVSDVYVARYSVDGTLTDDVEATSSLRAAISTIGTFDRTKVVDGYLVFGYSSQLRLGYDESKGFFVVPSAFSDKTGGYTFYYEGGIVCWSSTLAGNTNDFEIRRQLAPIEQSYVATVDGQFYANQTLTGIVKENNNGVLKVSTVEDPNNPPPAVPDEAGLKTVINYGGWHKLNTTTAGSPTASGTSFTNFTSNIASVVYAALPDSFKTASPEKIEAVVNFIYIPSNYETTLSTLVSDYTLNSGTWSGYSLRIKNGVVSLNVAFAGGTLTLDGTTALEEGASYAAKFVYNKSTSSVELFLSKDGGSFVSQGVITGEGDVSLSRVNYITFGKSYFSSYAYYNYIGTINLKGSYLTVNSEVWNGTKIAFGSVGVGYGYFKNTYFYPLGGQASDDKYVPYDGGLLTEDNVLGERATTMNIYLGRNADMGSWVSDTKGYLSTRESIVASVNKKLSTPVYLWHDLSYITPAVPETIEAVVDLGANTVSLPVSWKNVGGVLYEYPDGFPATQAPALSVNTVEGSNNLYVTKAGGTCGLAISSTSPAGVDSSAVIGTVELDANGTITSYTPGE